MQANFTKPGFLPLIAILALSVPGSLAAQQTAAPDPSIIVKGEVLPSGPEIKGVVAARNGDRIKVIAADGAATIITINEATRMKAGGGLFGGGGKYTTESLLNGLPVTVKTLQAADGLVASQITFKNNDLKTALMIRNGTNQRF